MSSRFRIPLPVRLGAALGVAVAGLTIAAALRPTPAPAEPAIESAIVSPAAARALGARWRESRRAEAGRDYAQALLAAGLNDELLAAITKEGLFDDDDVARALFRAEALLRVYRYKDAADLAAAPAIADNPYAAFIRVRASAGLGRGLDREALALATRGPAELAREAWLMRAQAALDDNDFAAADASLKRAAESGAGAARLEAFRIERDIRSGQTARAAAALDSRAKSLAKAATGRGAVLPDYEGRRLSAMLALRVGDGREAARLADRALLGAPGARDAPLAALAKWMAGDAAQARALLSAHLRVVPADWAAQDLAAAVAFAEGNRAEGEAHLAALATLRPRLTAFRRSKLAEAAREFDAAYSSVDGLSGEGSLVGAAAALLGSGTALPLLPEPLQADVALASVASAADLRSVRKATTALTGLRRSPVDLAVAAAALARTGDPGAASALAVEASEAAKGFLAPVVLQSAMLEAEGRHKEALAIFDQFLAADPQRTDAALARALLIARTGPPAAAAGAFAALDPEIAFSTDEAALAYARAAAATGEAARSAMLAAAAGSLPPARLAGVREAANDDAGAATAWREALIAVPSAEDFAERYRAVMARLGRAEDAEAFLEAVARRGEAAGDSRGGVEDADL
jgi:hypothetical protein